MHSLLESIAYEFGLEAKAIIGPNGLVATAAVTAFSDHFVKIARDRKKSLTLNQWRFWMVSTYNAKNPRAPIPADDWIMKPWGHPTIVHVRPGDE
jgi:hypothetical protein